MCRRSDARRKGSRRARRALLAAGLVCVACAAPRVASGGAARQRPDPIEDVQVRDGEDALAHLMAGNARFVADEPLHDHESRARRALLETGQHPYAVVLGCADSRVSPELIFDVGLGDLFVIRVAGNLVGRDELGSIEYALEHLGTPLVLVLGHEGCGAITAAFEEDAQHEPEELAQLLRALQLSLVGIDPALPLAERVQLGVEANVLRAVDELSVLVERAPHGAPRVVVAGAVYELGTGRVRLLGARAGRGAALRTLRSRSPCAVAAR